jgi:hypothetical protein
MRIQLILAITCAFISSMAGTPLSGAAPAFPPASAKAIHFEDAIAALPQDARPDPRHGWDDFTLPRARAALRPQLKGQRIEITCDLAQVQVKRVVDPRDSDKTVGWNVAVDVAGQPLNAFGLSNHLYPAAVTPRGRTAGSSHIEVSVSETAAKAARDWKPGDAIVITGMCADVSAERASSKDDKDEAAGVDFVCTLVNPEIKLRAAPTPQQPAAPPSLPVGTLKSLAASARAKLQARELEILKNLDTQANYRAATEEVEKAKVELNQAHEERNPTMIAAAVDKSTSARRRLNEIRQKTMEIDGQWLNLRIDSQEADGALLRAEQAAAASIKVVRFEDAMAALPANARPDTKHGFDEFTLPRAKTSLRDQLKDKRIEITSPLSQVMIKRIPDSLKQDKTVGWQLDIYTAGHVFKAQGLSDRVFPMAEASGSKPPRTTRVELLVNEATGKAAREWKEGDSITLSGVVVDVQGDRQVDGSGADFSVLLKDVKLERVVPFVEKPPVTPGTPDRPSSTIPQIRRVR